MITIQNLANLPEYIPVVAGWLFDEWGRFYPGITLQAWEADLRSNQNLDRIPLTLIALSDGAPAGTASLWRDDMESHPELTPWLAAVYVLSGQRNRGIGSQLVKAIEQTAQELHVSRFYLFTPDKEHFYSRLGWIVMERTIFWEKETVVMYRDFNAR